MKLSNLNLILALCSLVPFTKADDEYETITCSDSSHCPEEAPCCNQYGTCGTGKFCLGGCHPVFSYSADSCMPMPVCKNITTDFDDTSDLLLYDEYLGDAEEGDWVYSGYVQNYDDATIVAMPNQTSGTVISSTRFVWYGKIGATLRTSRGQGVVSAFILFSNAQDEIDYEFVGSNLNQVETNFYYQAVLNYTNGGTHDSSDTFDEYHNYEIDWSEDEINWYLDDELIRTLKKEDTYNATSKIYEYPQTPSRVQISLWPAGSSANAAGTIDWAGGEIDWNSEDIQEHGYYYAMLKSAYITCYDPPSGALIDGNTSYIFNSDTEFNQKNVLISNNNTILASNDATGLDPEEGASSSLSSSSSSSSSSKGSSSKTSSSSRTTTDTGSNTQTNEATATDDDATTSSRVTGFNQFSGASSSGSATATATSSSVASANGAGSNIQGGLLSTFTIALAFFVIL